MHIPQDLLNIIMRYKQDMELLESNTRTCHCFAPHFPIDPIDLLNFPIQVMYDYHEARYIYRQRLAVWGLDEIILPERVCPMLL